MALFSINLINLMNKDVVKVIVPMLNDSYKKDFAKHLNTMIFRKYKTITDKMYGKGKHIDIIRSILPYTNYLSDSYLTSVHVNDHRDDYRITSYPFRDIYEYIKECYPVSYNVYLVDEDSIYLIASDGIELPDLDVLKNTYQGNENICNIIDSINNGFANFIRNNPSKLKDILEKYIMICIMEEDEMFDYLIVYKKYLDKYVVVNIAGAQ